VQVFAHVDVTSCRWKSKIQNRSQPYSFRLQIVFRGCARKYLFHRGLCPELRAAQQIAQFVGRATAPDIDHFVFGDATAFALRKAGKQQRCATAMILA
jgi:hypothetical protein